MELVSDLSLLEESQFGFFHHCLKQILCLFAVASGGA